MTFFGREVEADWWEKECGELVGKVDGVFGCLLRYCGLLRSISGSSDS
jgi:hypothetical protein